MSYQADENDVKQPMVEPWKDPTQWWQLKAGMAPGQVRAILGEPGRVDKTMYGCRLWTYKGIVPGTGEVVGSIEFTSGRVRVIEPPNFELQPDQTLPYYRIGDIVRVRGIPSPRMVVAAENFIGNADGLTYVGVMWFNDRMAMCHRQMRVELIDRVPNDTPDAGLID